MRATWPTHDSLHHPFLTGSYLSMFATVFLEGLMVQNIDARNSRHRTTLCKYIETIKYRTPYHVINKHELWCRKNGTADEEAMHLEWVS